MSWPVESDSFIASILVSLSEGEASNTRKSIYPESLPQESITQRLGNRSRRQKESNRKTRKGAEALPFRGTEPRPFEIKFRELEQFKKKFGTTDVNFTKEHEKYRALAYFVSNQRLMFRHKKISKQRIEMLEGIGFNFHLMGRSDSLDSTNQKRRREKEVQIKEMNESLDPISKRRRTKY